MNSDSRKKLTTIEIKMKINSFYFYYISILNYLIKKLYNIVNWLLYDPTPEPNFSTPCAFPFSCLIPEKVPRVSREPLLGLETSNMEKKLEKKYMCRRLFDGNNGQFRG